MVRKVRSVNSGTQNAVDKAWIRRGNAMSPRLSNKQRSEKYQEYETAKKEALDRINADLERNDEVKRRLNEADRLRDMRKKARSR